MPVLKATIALTVMVLLLAGLNGCSTTSPFSPPAEPSDGPPAYVPGNLETLPDPVVTELERSAWGNPSSYTVAGSTYHVMKSGSRYTATGLASWYGSKFHGRRTSSGEPFDMFALTAAHTTLPIPAFAMVTNLDNGRSTVVRINDRGPFHPDRLIDVSYAAAVKLGFARNGTARVRLEVLEPAEDEYYLQAGAFHDLATADGLKSRVTGLTGEPAFVVKTGSDDLYRVRIGPVKGHSEAVRIQGMISSAALARPLILPF